MSTKARDLVNSSPPVVLQFSLNATQSVTSGSVDMLQYDEDVNAFLIIGTVSGSGSPAPGMTAVLQESPDGTTWTAISSGSGGTFAQATTSNTTQGLLFQRQFRFIRATLTVVGQTSPNLNTTIFLMEQLKQAGLGN